MSTLEKFEEVAGGIETFEFTPNEQILIRLMFCYKVGTGTFNRVVDVAHGVQERAREVVGLVAIHEKTQKAWWDELKKMAEQLGISEQRLDDLYSYVLEKENMF